MHRTLRDTLAGFSLAAALVAPFALIPPAEAAVPPPLVSGHRGATNVPGVTENSVQAVEYAGQAGASVVEVDARWTSDGYVVVLHDDTLDRTTRCSGPVERVTFKQLRRCADWRTVPILSHVYRAAGEHGMAVNVEVKAVAGRPLTDRQARQLVAKAADACAVQSTVWSSFSASTVAKVKAQPGARGGRFALIATSRSAVSPAAARRIGTVYMAQHTSLTAAKVREYARAGVQVWAWPAKTSADYARLRSLGVAVIVADDPAKAAAYVQAGR